MGAGEPAQTGSRWLPPPPTSGRTKVVLPIPRLSPITPQTNVVSAEGGRAKRYATPAVVGCRVLNGLEIGGDE